jgi:predicted enzyme related to lactoylglutathione lyase
MPNRDRYPAGVPCWVDTQQPDPKAGAEFYGELFGWQLEDVMPPEAPGRYFQATLGGGTVAAVGSADNGTTTARWTTYIAVEDADATTQRVREAGGEVLADPFDIFDAGRMAAFRDPEGGRFCVWQAGRHIGAEVVNTAGSWNWSSLNTGDPEGAQRFYGAVFGWEFSPTDMDGSIMVRRPGYADFLESIDPGVKARHKAGGAPDGFSDCIGWLDPIQGNGEPGWSVTFTIPDADGAAARVADLGGTILVEPFDVPWQRLVVIRDPQGAHLTLSQFKPPA